MGCIQWDTMKEISTAPGPESQERIGIKAGSEYSLVEVSPHTHTHTHTHTWRALRSGRDEYPDNSLTV